MDVVSYNRESWDREVEKKNIWTVPVTSAAIARAKKGEYVLILTPVKPVPEDWIGDVAEKKVLCLASGGGQQGPILSALGADVTVFDNSLAQLGVDEMVSKRDHLHITLEQGDMRDLSRFDEGTFDLVFHPFSNCFVEEIQATWEECFRVLKPGGALLSGFSNSIVYIFDIDEWDKGRLVVSHSIPYSDLKQLPKARLRKLIDEGEPVEFGHSLDSQIGGQIQAGFAICGFYEDSSGGNDLLDPFISTSIATRAIKPSV